MIAITLSLGLSGCGTILNMGAGTCPIRDYPLPYGGVLMDGEVLAVAQFPFGLLIALIDFPFSLAGDTVTLPWAIYATVTHPSHDEEKPAGGRSSGRDP